jgi:hypothetical protein
MVPSYKAFAALESTTPADPTLLPQYTTPLAARGRAVAWPPQRGRRAGAARGRRSGSATARAPDIFERRHSPKRTVGTAEQEPAGPRSRGEQGGRGIATNGVGRGCSPVTVAHWRNLQYAAAQALRGKAVLAQLECVAPCLTSRGARHTQLAAPAPLVTPT